jgi:hypothetical protein
MTEDEQPLHVSRNTSLDGAKGVDRLHRLMGYGSASDLTSKSGSYVKFDFKICWNLNLKVARI